MTDGRRVPVLSATRRLVYNTIASTQDGLLAREVGVKAGIGHGTVQQTLHYLRDKGLVKAEPIHAAA